MASRQNSGFMRDNLSATPLKSVGRQEFVRFSSDLISMHCNGMLIRVADTVTEVDEKLCETALGGCIVAKNRTECCISEGFGKALAKGFTGASVIRQSLQMLAYVIPSQSSD